VPYSDIEFVRAALSARIRDRIGGPGIDEKREEYFNAPGERWFGPDAVIRRVHGDTSMFIGGLRALLLQSLHPLAMAGVDKHSDFRNDPWGRLQRTADFIAVTTFGPDEMATAMINRVKAVHATVVGTADDGRAYAASDPNLLRWVHVAEVDSFLRSFQTYGAGPLTPQEADQYVSEMGMISERLGATGLPQSVAELDAQIEAFRPELYSTPAARSVARYLVLTPPLPVAQRPIYGVIASASVALLPKWARMPLRLPYLPFTEKMLFKPGGVAITKALRWIVEPDQPGREKSV